MVRPFPQPDLSHPSFSIDALKKVTTRTKSPSTISNTAITLATATPAIAPTDSLNAHKWWLIHSPKNVYLDDASGTIDVVIELDKDGIVILHLVSENYMCNKQIQYRDDDSATLSDVLAIGTNGVLI